MNKSINAIRYTLKLAIDRFERAGTYANAVNLQNAQRDFDNFFKGERDGFFVINNDNPVANPSHISPTHFRVIEGGKKDIQIKGR